MLSLSLYVIVVVGANLLRLAVGIAAVVEVAAYVSLEGGVDEQLGIERHEVEVLASPLRARLAALLKLAQIDHLANILDQKRVS